MEEINDTLWSLGWQFGMACFLAIVFAGTAIYASGSYFGAAAALIAMIPWYKGTRYINKNWDAVYDAILRQAENAGADKLEINRDEADIFHLMNYSGRAIGISRNRRYGLSVIYVGENQLAIYDSARIDMVNREFIPGSSTTKLDYQQMKSVDFSPPYLIIQTIDEDKLSYKSTDADPEPALNLIREKIQSAQAS